MGYFSIKHKSFAEIEVILEENLKRKNLTKIDKYKDYFTPIKVLCKDHGTLHKLPKAILSGHGCFKCALEKTTSKQKIDVQSLPHLKQLGIRFVSRVGRKIILACPRHGEFSSTIKTACDIRKNPCYKCVQEVRVQSFKIDKLKKILDLCKERNIELAYLPLDMRNKFNIGIVCKDHGFSLIGYHSFVQGSNCYSCGKRSAADLKRWQPEKISDLAKERGYETISLPDERLTVKSRVVFSCPKHGSFETTINGFRDGSGCPRCVHHVSKPESDIASFISDLIGPEKVSTSNRSIVPPKELDIFIPSHNLAIEYCGEYWHSEQKRGRLAHYDKWKACDQKNVQLITIFENSFKDRKDQYLKYIESKLQLSKLIVGARKCQVEEIDAKLAKSFIEKYHIQGFSRSSFCVALKLEGELVGIMSFAPHHRQANADIVVLNRLCFKSGVTIQGGASKMLKFAIPLLKAKGYISIITWSDNCLSNGNVYEKMGFKLDKELPPDYFYSSGKQSRSKQNSTKKALLKMGATGTTELEMAQSLGYERIWDCGKKRWALNL